MIELYLIGYTEDGDHLVLDLDPDGEGRYLVPVDPDLLATLEVVRGQRLAAGKPVDRRAAPPPRPEPEPAGAGADGPAPGPFPPPRGAPAGNGRGPAGAEDPGPAWSRPAGAATAPPRPADVATPADEPDAPDEADERDQEPGEPERSAVDDPPGPAPVAGSRLSPAQIQARLRAGRSVRAVAREAGVDRDWVERWNDPIRAERERVLTDARSRRVDAPRARPLGAAVDRSLADRGVDPATAAWRVARRDDGRWRVSVRFEERGRARTATWLLDPDADRLRAQSALASELAAPGRAKPRR